MNIEELCDDAADSTCFVGVFRQRLVRDEVSISLYGEAEAAPKSGEFGQRDEAKLRAAKSKITQAKEPVRIIGVHLRDEPSRCRHPA